MKSRKEKATKSKNILKIECINTTKPVFKREKAESAKGKRNYVELLA